MKGENMTSRNLLTGILAVFAIFAVMAFASSSVQVDEDLVSITALELNGVDVLNDDAPFAEFAGTTLPVTVQFKADNLGQSVSEDVRVKAWISGESTNSYVSERFDVLEGRIYTRTMNVPFPFDLNDETEDSFVLNVLLESDNDGDLARIRADVTIQRRSYLVEVLDVDMDNQVMAGEYLAIDVVLKNRGRQMADDSFAEVTIPALGISDRGYFGDLSAVDQTDPDKEDSNERRLYVKIPSNAPAGLYDVQVKAFNDDSATTVTKKVVIRASAEESVVVSPAHSKSFSAGETVKYSMTIVNSGSKIQVYELVTDPSTGLDLEIGEPVLAVPAGSSKTVTIEAFAEEEGKYQFAVNVHSDGQLVKTESFTANVEGKTTLGAGTGNATVVLTVILAIIFVVLLVVLIVLLTRKPQKGEEISESYY